MLHGGGEPPPWKLPQTLTLTICEQLFLLWYSTRLFSDAERDPLDIAKFLVYMRPDIQQAGNVDATRTFVVGRRTWHFVNFVR